MRMSLIVLFNETFMKDINLLEAIKFVNYLSISHQIRLNY